MHNINILIIPPLMPHPRFCLPPVGQLPHHTPRDGGAYARQEISTFAWVWFRMRGHGDDTIKRNTCVHPRYGLATSTPRIMFSHTESLLESKRTYIHALHRYTQKHTNIRRFVSERTHTGKNSDRERCEQTAWHVCEVPKLQDLTNTCIVVSTGQCAEADGWNACARSLADLTLVISR